MPFGIVRRVARATGLTYGTMAQVDAHVFIGGYLAAADRGLLHRHGITRVLRVCPWASRKFPGGGGPHPGLAYRVLPIPDASDFDFGAVAEACVAFLRETVARGERVLVHCHAGISRSATAVLLYLMAAHGLGLDDALARLRVVRPQANPNPGFWRFLRRAEVRLAALRGGGAGKLKLAARV